MTKTNYESSERKEPMITVDDTHYFDIDYIVRLLRDMQSGRYSTFDCEKEYVCIENIVQCLRTQEQFLSRNYWIGGGDHDDT